MHARSALFDLYGDYLRQRGGCAPIASLVCALAPVGITGPAVRTAVSRMVRQGWLRATDSHGARGYALTARAMHRLDQSAARIYRTRHKEWDGNLDMVLFSPPTHRSTRAQLATALRFHGYGPLSAGTWISPWQDTELEQVFHEADITFTRFSAAHHGDTAALACRAWDLDDLALRYLEFISTMGPVVATADPQSDSEAAYTARFQLVHAFRVFLFSDPQLPPQLCPPNWAGADAAAFFDTHAARLRPAADHFVDQCLPPK
ncbi:MAG TPA: PaaX family transcriptional regulator [Candidatus Stackebrandtia faecavium]|nr:PaaX family transcriptional regulator [Candidatus Stackebrandtia faecavium]